MLQIKPLKELIALSKEKLDEAMAPMRARREKAKAELEMVKIESSMLDMEGKIQEMLTGKNIDFPKLMDRLDEYALLERRKQQYDDILLQLFPEEKV